MQLGQAVRTHSCMSCCDFVCMAGLCGQFLRNRVTQRFTEISDGWVCVKSPEPNQSFFLRGWNLASSLDVQSWSCRHVQFQEERKEGVFVLDEKNKRKFL